MPELIPVVRKKRGRPPTGQDPVTAVRLSPALKSQIEDWAKQQPDKPSRSEAIRRLVELALAAKAKRRPWLAGGRPAGRYGEPASSPTRHHERRRCGGWLRWRWSWNEPERQWRGEVRFTTKDTFGRTAACHDRPRDGYWGKGSRSSRIASNQFHM